MDSTKTERAPGRPRNPEVERRILEVTLEQLSDLGYNRMSLDSIADQAGASKPTIYRRWSNKADLATAAISSLRLNEPPIDTGTTTGDLIALLNNFRKSLLRPNGMALIGTVLVEESHTPELLHLFRERVVKPRREMLRVILDRARTRGELRADADTEAAINMLIGSFYAHYMANPRVPLDFGERIVNAIWRGISRTR